MTGYANVLFNENDYQNGLAAIEKKPICFTCHKTKEKNVGPSFLDIANRYERINESIFDKLSKKIRNGGTGSWGVTFMPHNSLSKDEADVLLKYILLTKYK